MANPSNQNTQKKDSKSNPNLIPDAMQGTDDTQSEFSVSATREERREDERKADEHAAQPEAGQDSDAAVTQSEFSVNERLRGNS